MTGTGMGRRAALGGAAGVTARTLFGRAQAQDTPVRIGVLTDASSQYANNVGPGSIAAAKMAAQDFGGTVLGKGIEILHADTQNRCHEGWR